MTSYHDEHENELVSPPWTNDDKLVERLRADALDADSTTDTNGLLLEAASAIERLSAIEQERDALRDAVRDLIASRSDTYRAGNNRQVGMQDENGEKMWLVPFDEMHALELLLEGIK